MDDRITEAGSDLADVRRAHGTPPWLPSVAHPNQTLGAMRLLEGNDARLLTDFDDQFAAMVAAANAAQRYLYVEYYALCPTRPPLRSSPPSAQPCNGASPYECCSTIWVAALPELR